MTLSFAEIDSQHVELLPARTVMSLFTLGGKGGNGGSADSGPASCAVSIGSIPVGVGIIAGVSQESTGYSCNSIATGGHGGNG
ncbi:MAG TPA: hypothetical protein VGO16_10360 [Pseudonocardiaceae bacterium]|jgi:hypothetical protein|nr:hypothetical protein [Pseudonocardiaceae bacterium]